MIRGSVLMRAGALRPLAGHVGQRSRLPLAARFGGSHSLSFSSLSLSFSSQSCLSQQQFGFHRNFASSSTNSQTVTDSEQQSDDQMEETEQISEMEEHDEHQYEVSEMEDGDQQYSEVSEGDQQYSEMEEGDQQYSEMEEGDQQYSEMEEGDQQYSEMEEGDQQYSEMEEGDQQYENSEMEEGDQQYEYTEVSEGDQQYEYTEMEETDDGYEYTTFPGESTNKVDLPESHLETFIDNEDDRAKMEEFERMTRLANSNRIEDIAREIPESEFQYGMSVLWEKPFPFRRNLDLLGFQFRYDELIPRRELGQPLQHRERYMSQLRMYAGTVAPTPTQVAILKEMAGPRYTGRGAHHEITLTSRNLSTRESNKHRVFDQALYLLHKSAELAEQFNPTEWELYAPRRAAAKAAHEEWVAGLHEERLEMTQDVLEHVSPRFDDIRLVEDQITDPNLEGYITKEQFLVFMEQAEQEMLEMGVSLVVGGDGKSHPLRQVIEVIFEEHPHITPEDALALLQSRMDEAGAIVQHEDGMPSPRQMKGMTPDMLQRVAEEYGMTPERMQEMMSSLPEDVEDSDQDQYDSQISGQYSNDVYDYTEEGSDAEYHSQVEDSDAEYHSQVEEGSDAEQHSQVEEGSDAEYHSQVEEGSDAEYHSQVEDSDAEYHSQMEEGSDAEQHSQVEEGSDAEYHSQMEEGSDAEYHSQVEEESGFEEGSAIEEESGSEAEVSEDEAAGSKV